MATHGSSCLDDSLFMGVLSCQVKMDFKVFSFLVVERTLPKS
jgi:hypothetical protein